MELAALLTLSVLPVLVIVAGLKDLTTMTIPNWISAALLACFFPAALLVGLEPLQIAIHVGVAAAALAVGAGMFAMGWLGGGDAKLMASASLWLGLAGAGQFVLWTAMAGGLFSLVLLLVRSRAAGLPALPGAPGWLGRLLQPKGDIPYGVAIAAGALIAFPGSAMVAAFAAA